VTGPPTTNQVRCDPLVGKLSFATPLPATGNVVADYWVGRWERRVARLEGTLRIDLCATAVADVIGLSEAVIEALTASQARTSIQRLLALQLSGIGTIGSAETATAGGARRRVLRFAFVFENLIDRPDSSGGIIQRVRSVTHLAVANLDSSGTISESLVTESE